MLWLRKSLALMAFHLNILALFAMLWLFRSAFSIFQLIVGGNIQMNIFLGTICQFDYQTLEEVYFRKGQN
jgi:hypothetical protein